jgi:hypothetical protein
MTSSESTGVIGDTAAAGLEPLREGRPLAGHWPARSRDFRRRCWTGAILFAGFTSIGVPGQAAQSFRNKTVYFGDAHWHSCLSQDAGKTTPTAQYESMLRDYHLDFSMQAEHAEAATAGITQCDTYLPEQWIYEENGIRHPRIYRGESIANAMKQAADAWNGLEQPLPDGRTIKFVTFPGYEWAPDARCWRAAPWDPNPSEDLNSNDNTPGHINYFFSDTTGWTYSDDVWEPGAGDSFTCTTGSVIGLSYFLGDRDYEDEILGQLIHQRDDPDRAYDLMIQYNHPAASSDKEGSFKFDHDENEWSYLAQTSDHLAKWRDFEHASSYCSVAPGAPACTQMQCEAFRRAYGVTSVEWYTNQEATIGSTAFGTVENHDDDESYHEHFHKPTYWVSSRGLGEGYRLASTGGSDSHDGRKGVPGFHEAPGDAFPGGRGAGSGSLTAVYASEASRSALWDGLTRRRTYALSRFRGRGPVHKGRVDFFTSERIGNEVGVSFALAGDVGGIPTKEYGMGEMVEAVTTGTTRNFTISAAAEEGTSGVVPVELRLYRVNYATELSGRTDVDYPWLDDITGDPGKFGELVGRFGNQTSSSTLTHTFAEVIVRPGDALFAVVPFSDYTWTDDYLARDRSPLDADGDGAADDGKSGYAHTDNNTWARSTPIFFHASQERPNLATACEHVTFNFSGSAGELAAGGLDADLPGDDGVLPVAIPDGYAPEWNRWRFSLEGRYDYLDLSFYTASDEEEPGTLFAVRIDGQLVYSGRSGVDHEADRMVDLHDIPFSLESGLHELEIHMDSASYAKVDDDPEFHCTDYVGAPAFLDAVVFRRQPGMDCYDETPPVITCPASLTEECGARGGSPASAPAIAAFLAAAGAVDDFDTSPTVTHDAPAVLPLGTTSVTFTATDDSGNAASCSAAITIRDRTPPALASFDLAPRRLVPPNHRLVPISVPALEAVDGCDPEPRILCEVESDEGPNGLGDGNSAFDIRFNGSPVFAQGTGVRRLDTQAGAGTFELALRAERSALGNGRVYTTSCVAVDAAGNRGTARSASVVVPR